MTGSAPDRRRALAAIVLALASALFFTQTYVLNRAVASDGGHWAWTASLRYLITLPLLLPLMPWQGGSAPVLRALRAHPRAWLACAGLGFVEIQSCPAAEAFAIAALSAIWCGSAPRAHATRYLLYSVNSTRSTSGCTIQPPLSSLLLTTG